MNSAPVPEPVSDPFRVLVERALQRLRAASPGLATLLDNPVVSAQVARVAVASDFAIVTLSRQPQLLAGWIDDSSVPQPVPVLEPGGPWPALLRQYRTAESTRLVWRDVLGLDDVDAT
ncbi:MAG: glutamine-synthetase adenylyltransferase, partial [Luteimonas sp.]